jgi:hypothetical protein
LDQTRSDIQRASEELGRDGVSQAVAAGARAEQNLQDLREDLRRETSSQFAEQMRELRRQARELAQQEETIARNLESLASSARKSLSETPEQRQLSEQVARQQTALTNLLGGMREVVDQSESTEPLLSRQLYDSLRRTDQAQTERLLNLGAQLVNRGFLPQAQEVERAVRQNLDNLRRDVERAAESVLGDETDDLRYALNELDDLARQVESELKQSETNTLAAEAVSRPESTVHSQSPEGLAAESGGDESDTNGLARTSAASSSERARDRGTAGRAGDEDRREPASGRNRRGDGAESPRNAQSGEGANSLDRLRQLAEQLGSGSGVDESGPITGSSYLNWSDRLRDVERVLDADDMRNQLATVRERVGVLRGDYRDRGLAPSPDEVKNHILTPMTQVRVWVRQELARRENIGSLVPLDRDPVPDRYSDLVRKYYERLGSAE